jgi:hypothetical protein
MTSCSLHGPAMHVAIQPTFAFIMQIYIGVSNARVVREHYKMPSPPHPSPTHRTQVRAYIAMGFARKSGVAVVRVWWLLLLAGVLLPLAAAFGRHADAGNDMCDIKCQHHSDPARRQQCVDECHSREHHHPSREFCEMKCQHHQDPARKEICVQQCMSYGLSLRRASAGVDEGEKRFHGWETTVAGGILEVV